MSRFYKCMHCGNIIGKIEDKGVSVVCCGEKMKELVANTEEASTEKHIPVVTIEGDVVKVNVGSIQHPMEPNHYISWIYLETENGGQRKMCNQVPQAEFKVVNDQVKAVYAYCNLHGLWKYEVK